MFREVIGKPMFLVCQQQVSELEEYKNTAAPPLRKCNLDVNDCISVLPLRDEEQRTGRCLKPTVNVQVGPGADGRHAAAAQDGLALVEAGVAHRRPEDG